MNELASATSVVHTDVKRTGPPPGSVESPRQKRLNPLAPAEENLGHDSPWQVPFAHCGCQLQRQHRSGGRSHACPVRQRAPAFQLCAHRPKNYHSPQWILAAADPFPVALQKQQPDYPASQGYGGQSQDDTGQGCPWQAPDIFQRGSCTTHYPSGE
eukprot:CAMPEP_0117683584 /NCGR_PEP_ID=MMETSP0804-20121206/20501_1 /TAXON_ID=1074897 /ORGANISM="Tetraselmis astigmatica, Strain CCMP880" /LENGTH=155 /DNA_ID=CAMNT_0005494233 /DNA_START=275 /DNA_END=741 /DNA_ORIENTATION=+